jgi:hypothetical protein
MRPWELGVTALWGAPLGLRPWGHEGSYFEGGPLLGPLNGAL